MAAKLSLSTMIDALNELAERFPRVMATLLLQGVPAVHSELFNRPVHDGVAVHKRVPTSAVAYGPGRPCVNMIDLLNALEFFDAPDEWCSIGYFFRDGRVFFHIKVGVDTDKDADP